MAETEPSPATGTDASHRVLEQLSQRPAQETLTAQQVRVLAEMAAALTQKYTTHE